MRFHDGRNAGHERADFSSTSAPHPPAPSPQKTGARGSNSHRCIARNFAAAGKFSSPSNFVALSNSATPSNLAATDKFADVGKFVGRAEVPIVRLGKWFAFLLFGVLAGCSTHSKRLMEPRSLYHQGQMDECRVRLEKLAKNHRSDRDVAKLDLAMVDLISGRPKQAEQLLREVRDRFEYLEQDSLAEKTLSVWTDDQQRAYAGEDYEKILVYAFLALFEFDA